MSGIDANQHYEKHLKVNLFILRVWSIDLCYLNSVYFDSTHNNFLTQTTSMNTDLINSDIPQQEEYLVTIHHQPIHLNCQSRKEDGGFVPPSGNIIRLDDQVTIQNYYCYEGNDELVKITKIRAGNQTVTLTDRITIYNTEGRNEKKWDEDYKTISNTTSAPQAESKSELAQQVIKKFKNWIMTNQSKLLPILKTIIGNSFSEEELKSNINGQAEVRQAFFRFRHSVNSSKNGKKLKVIINEWHKSFLPAHKRHLKNEAYLNKILANAIEANE